MKDVLKSNRLIAISGVKSSGKDTVSNMIRYCLSVPKIARLSASVQFLVNTTRSGSALNILAKTVRVW